MLLLNLSLLKREYTQMNVLEALASIISMCGLHAIFLSKITGLVYTPFSRLLHSNGSTLHNTERGRRGMKARRTKMRNDYARKVR
jgi:hypothetical protein